MKSGQAVNERVAISRGNGSPFASSVRRRTAVPFFVFRGMTAVYEDPYLLFCLPTQVAGAGGGGHRERTCTGLDEGPFEFFLPTSSPN
ncbi:MAG TPA: hypothetical protein VEQ12_12740 [Candidatus Limnocylindria bacterium]|nr:hypothetical protein [Candidatus Limnocylindria bacterium]